MGSMANPSPWVPYDSYRDCSEGICNIYCPQWCYVFPPPPPSFFLDDDGDSSSHFSPLLIALIGVFASAFILVSYYTLFSKFCRGRRNGASPSHDRDISFSAAADNGQGHGAQAEAGDGLDQALIKSIKVHKYRKGDGFVDCSDCSVCLSEFQENESLRLLPKCKHAFHVPCIDTWLISHSSCPLCRASLTTAAAVAVSVTNHPTTAESGNRGGGRQEISSSAIDHQHQISESSVVVEDLGSGAGNETVVTGDNVRSPPKPPEREPRDNSRMRTDEEQQPIQVSVSRNSSAMNSVAGILQQREGNDEESGGAGTSRGRQEEEEEHGIGKSAKNQRNGVSNFLVQSSMAMKRSVSTGRSILTRYDQPDNYSLPT